MLKNYLTSALRSMTKSPFYSLLNIAGLTVGLTTFIFIFIYVSDELTYDKHHDNHDRIYRLESNFTIGTKHDRFAIVPIPMAPALQLEYPEIESIVRFADIDNVLIKIGDKEFYEDDFYFTDSTIFNVFSHKLIVGDLEGSLTEPNTAVLTRSIANKYYGKVNPVGEIFETGDGRIFKVTAVIEDLPGNSHLRFKALLSAATLAAEDGEEEFNSMEADRFWNIGVYSYILLNKNSDIESIHQKFPDFYIKYMKELGDVFNASFKLETTKLSDVHLTSDLSADLPTGNISYVYIFGAAAIFILLLAAINYMNMATARSSERSREIGMRKVIGAERRQLISQFLSESVLMSFLSMIFAMALVGMFMNDFNTLSGKELSFNILYQPVNLLFILFISFFIGLLSGTYPAFFLSSFKPLSVLKGIIGGNGKSNLMLRRSLVVFQFFVAIVIIISTFVVSDQLHFLKNKDLGFNKENVVVLEMQDSAFRSKVKPFKETLLQNTNIVNVANSTGVPGRNSWIQVMLVEQDTEMKEFAVILTQSDYDYPELMEFNFLQGRNFDLEMSTDDTAAVIVNETAVKQFGWSDNPIGKKIHYGMDLDRSGGRIMKVIGVVKDYHFTSLHNNIEPIIMFISPVNRYFVSVRIKEGKLNEALKDIETIWHDYNAQRPFDYKLLSDIQEDMYKGEEKITTIFIMITIITVVIAILGLFGLASFTTEQRTREIGIRKVNGATVGDIVLMLYKEFIWIILIAFVLAVPIAYWRLTIWLESAFVYTVEINWVTIALAGILALVIGLATISFHVIRAASSNPVDAIKYE